MANIPDMAGDICCFLFSFKCVPLSQLAFIWAVAFATMEGIHISCSNTSFVKCLSKSHQNCTVFSRCSQTAGSCILVLCFYFPCIAVARIVFDRAFAAYRNVLFVIVLFQQPLLMTRQQWVNRISLFRLIVVNSLQHTQVATLYFLF